MIRHANNQEQQQQQQIRKRKIQRTEYNLFSLNNYQK